MFQDQAFAFGVVSAVVDAEVVVVGFDEVVFAVVVDDVDVVDDVVDDVVELGVEDDVFSSALSLESSGSSSDESLASSTRLLPTRGDPVYLAAEAWLLP